MIYVICLLPSPQPLFPFSPYLLACTRTGLLSSPGTYEACPQFRAFVLAEPSAADALPPDLCMTALFPPWSLISNVHHPSLARATAQSPLSYCPTLSFSDHLGTCDTLLVVCWCGEWFPSSRDTLTEGRTLFTTVSPVPGTHQELNRNLFTSCWVVLQSRGNIKSS